MIKVVEPRQTRFRLGHTEELMEEDGSCLYPNKHCKETTHPHPKKIRWWQRVKVKRDG